VRITVARNAVRIEHAGRIIIINYTSLEDLERKLRTHPGIEELATQYPRLVEVILAVATQS